MIGNVSKKNEEALNRSGDFESIVSLKNRRNTSWIEQKIISLQFRGISIKIKL